MNIPVLIVALIMAAAVLGHVLIGTRETATLEPIGQSGKPMANWVQTMCAFQMLSVDLLLLTILLFALAITDLVPAAPQVTWWLAVYFAVQGVLWFAHIRWFNRDGATLATLPHWAAWFICAGLLWLGVQPHA